MVARISTIGIALLGTFVAWERASGEDWQRFRGPNGTGVSTSTNLPSELAPDKNVKWSIDVQRGTSSPIVVGGKLFLASYKDDDRVLQCLDAKTGQELWRQTSQKARGENFNRLNGPATCTPAADADHVVVLFPDVGLLCYSLTGELKWRTDVGPFYSMHGMANSPIIVGDKVILLADLVKESHIAAYDLKDGHQVWKVARTDGVTGGFSTPGVITDAQGTPSLITVGADGLLAYKPETGDQLFSVPGVSNVPVTVPVVSGTSVYLCEPVGEIEPMSQYMKDPQDMDTNDDGKLSLEEVKRSVAFYRMLESMDQRWGNKDGMVEEAEWNAAFGSMLDKGGLVAVQLPQPDAQTPSIRWTYTKALPYIASPVCYDDVLYIIRDQGLFMSVNTADGSVIKTDRLKKGGKEFYASPVAGDGKVYVVDRSGRLTVLKAGAQWEELSSADFGEEIDSTPAICDGLIYLRTPTKLYCFGQ